MRGGGEKRKGPPKGRRGGADDPRFPLGGGGEGKKSSPARFFSFFWCRSRNLPDPGVWECLIPPGGRRGILQGEGGRRSSGGGGTRGGEKNAPTIFSPSGIFPPLSPPMELSTWETSVVGMC